MRLLGYQDVSFLSTKINIPAVQLGFTNQTINGPHNQKQCLYVPSRPSE